MKVLMVTPDCFMIDRRIILEAKTLINAGYEVTLLAGFECSEETHYLKDGISIYRYKYDWEDKRLERISSFLPRSKFLNKCYSRLIKPFYEMTAFEYFMLEKISQFEADVYHAHDFPCLKAAVYAARKRKIPLIYDAHEIYYSQRMFPDAVQQKYFKEEKKYIKYADIVITVNQFISDIMAKQYKTTPEVIMNCAEMPVNFNPAESYRLLKNKIKVAADWKIILYQGWLSPERNIEALIKGVRFLPDKCCLVIIGYGEYEGMLRKIASEEKVQEKIFFLGKISPDEILHYTAGADIGVIPYLPIDENHRYCSPNKFFEYILAGIPVITNNSFFFRAMNEKYGVVHTIDTFSPEKFAQAVTEMLFNKSKFNEMKNNCYKAAKELNWDVEGKKLLSVYNRLKASINMSDRH